MTRSSKTVLVIEDNPLNLKLATTILTFNGYTVLTASDAETGLVIARAEQPALIMMD